MRSHKRSNRYRRSRPPWAATGRQLDVPAGYEHWTETSYVAAHSGELVIPTEFGPIPIPVAIPHEAPPLHIPRLGDNYTWDDVNHFVSGTAGAAIDAVTGLFSDVKSLTFDAVKQMITDALAEAQTAWSSFVSLGIDLTVGVFDQLTNTLDALTGYTLGEISFLIDEIAWVSGAIDNIGGAVIGEIYDELHGLERAVVNGIEGVTSFLETWAIDNIANPLLRDIADAARWVEAEIGGAVDVVRDDLTRLIESVDTGLLARVGALALAIAGLAEWVRTCGQPMCDNFGPGSKLGNILKTLEGLLGVLAGLELANLTEADLEAWAQRLAGIGSGGIDALLGGFVEGGETVGAATGDLLGEITDVGRSLLNDLGVPA